MGVKWIGLLDCYMIMLVNYLVGLIVFLVVFEDANWVPIGFIDNSERTCFSCLTLSNLGGNSGT